MVLQNQTVQCEPRQMAKLAADYIWTIAVFRRVLEFIVHIQALE